MRSGKNWLRYAILAILTVALTRGMFLGAPDDSQADWIMAIRVNSWKDLEATLSSVPELKLVEDTLTSPLLDVLPGELASVTVRTDETLWGIRYGASDTIQIWKWDKSGRATCVESKSRYIHPFFLVHQDEAENQEHPTPEPVPHPPEVPKTGSFIEGWVGSRAMASGLHEAFRKAGQMENDHLEELCKRSCRHLSWFLRKNPGKGAREQIASLPPGIWTCPLEGKPVVSDAPPGATLPFRILCSHEKPAAPDGKEPPRTDLGRILMPLARFFDTCNRIGFRWDPSAGEFILEPADGVVPDLPIPASAARRLSPAAYWLERWLPGNGEIPVSADFTEVMYSGERLGEINRWGNTLSADPNQEVFGLVTAKAASSGSSARGSPMQGVSRANWEIASGSLTGERFPDGSTTERIVEVDGREIIASEFTARWGGRYFRATVEAGGFIWCVTDESDLKALTRLENGEAPLLEIFPHRGEAVKTAFGFRMDAFAAKLLTEFAEMAFQKEMHRCTAALQKLAVEQGLKSWEPPKAASITAEQEKACGRGGLMINPEDGTLICAIHQWRNRAFIDRLVPRVRFPRGRWFTGLVHRKNGRPRIELRIVTEREVRR